MKNTFFVKATVGDNGCRVAFNRKAVEKKGHREVTQYGCFGDGISEDIVEKLVELLEVVAFDGDEEHPFLEGRVELEFNVVGEPEEYEVPEDFIPDGIKSITVYTTPVEITGVGEPSADRLTELLKKKLKSAKPRIIKSKD